ncbi:MAG: thrombospondin type 3 repeat-containing protein [Candidatus Binatia bacterium]
MKWRGVLFALWTVVLACLPRPAQANSVRYVLTEESRLVRFCETCDRMLLEPEVLRGSFELSVLPVASQASIDAITRLQWRSASATVTGSGFLQRFGDDRVALVVDGRINGASMLITSGRRQKVTPQEIRLHLSTPKAAGGGYLLTIVAVPAPLDGPDGDADSVVDRNDNCPQAANATQADADTDGVGDACDTCAATPLGTAVRASGCALEQDCPCDGPTVDDEWKSQRAYVQCVARHLKQLRQSTGLGRSEVRRLLHDAVRSGCGRRIIASL